MLLKEKGRSETTCGFRTKRSTSLLPGATKPYKKKRLVTEAQLRFSVFREP